MIELLSQESTFALAPSPNEAERCKNKAFAQTEAGRGTFFVVIWKYLEWSANFSEADSADTSAIFCLQILQYVEGC